MSWRVDFSPLRSSRDLRLLFVSAILLAGLDGIQRPSLAALVPQLVEEDQYPATSSLMVLRSQVGEITAPALTGLLIAAGGLAATYAVDMASYLVSLGFLAALGVAPPPPEDAELSLAAVREGLRYAWTRKDLLGTYLVDMNAMFFGMPNALFPAFAVRLGGPSALGVLYAAPALGSFLVTLTSGWSSRVRRYGRMIAIAAVVWGLGIVALGFSHA